MKQPCNKKKVNIEEQDMNLRLIFRRGLCTGALNELPCISSTQYRLLLQYSRVVYQLKHRNPAHKDWDRRTKMDVPFP